MALDTPDYEGSFKAMCPSDVDETELLFSPGMTLADVKEAAYEAHFRMDNVPGSDKEEVKAEARRRAGEIIGAWVVPDEIGSTKLWEMIGSVMDTPSYNDSGMDTLLEAVYRVVEALSVQTIDA